MSAFRGKADMAFRIAKCLLLTQSGHRRRVNVRGRLYVISHSLPDRKVLGFEPLAQGVVLTGGTCSGASSRPPSRRCSHCVAAVPNRSGRKTQLIGVLANEAWPPLDGLRNELRELGYIGGQNFNIMYRFAEGQADRYPALAAELVRMPVDVIVTWGILPVWRQKMQPMRSRSS